MIPNEDSDDLTDRYTVEERKMIDDVILDAAQECNLIRFSLGLELKVCGKMPGTFKEGPLLQKELVGEDRWRMLSLPIEEMPLYINDLDFYRAGIARWRLLVGK